jgi:hypothetical protein
MPAGPSAGNLGTGACGDGREADAMPLHVAIAGRAEAGETVLLSARLGGAGGALPHPGLRPSRHRPECRGAAGASFRPPYGRGCRGGDAGGHAFTVEQPEPFNRLLMEFLGG